ncbi:tetratricopeptide repeat protein [Streptomyces sp. NPDC056169]|uniref:ATP-binding protein n=1 Tax=Streptomyces sp. NPDC056169 TaxID=3345734 RepID=UPI0035E05381
MNRTEEPEEFGACLRALRVRAGLSQERLAHAAGVSVRALADLERGRTRGPQRRTVQALARAMELGTVEEARLESAAALGRPRPRARTDLTLSGLLALPRDAADFTARNQDVAALRSLAVTADPAHPPVAVVSGSPGLGKTAFAVHAAHLLAADFPDGQFWLDLRGMDPRPVGPGDALARLLRALGVAERSLPRDLADRSGLWRSLVAGRRLLLVLDNAVDEQQVRPLLPSAGAGLTVVTSRHALAGLEAVHRVELPLLRREEAVELLTRIVGSERVTREAQAARDLADLCGRLPLAVRIAGQRLAARPREHLARLAALLEDEERRLDALQAGDLKVRAAFALSYRQLDPAARLLLRRSALAAGPDFSPETAALLSGTPLDDTRLHLEGLCDQGLLQADPAAERYGFHDLLGLFAAERLAAEDDPETRREAVDRTARWMLSRATAAALHFDAERHDEPTGDPDPSTAPAGRTRARAWLEAEQPQWLAALAHAGAAGWHRRVVDTAEAMHWFSDRTQHWEEWVDVFRYAAHAARALGSPREEATHLNYLAWAHNICAHDPRAAFEAALGALDAARACGDLLQTGWALGYGAGALRRLGRTDEAIAWLRDSEVCHRENTSPEGRLALLSTLNTLGETLRCRGDVREALAHHRRSLAICEEGIPGQAPDLLAIYQAVALRHLGDDYAALGRWPDAEPPLRQALGTFTRLDMPAWTGPIQLDLGRVLRHLDRPLEARAAVTAAVLTLTEHHSPRQAEAAAELRTIIGTPHAPSTSEIPAQPGPPPRPSAAHEA